MRIKVDKNSDTFYFRLDKNRIVESEDVRPGVVLDFDEHDKVVGVEFLGISARASTEALHHAIPDCMTKKATNKMNADYCRIRAKL